MSNYIIIIIIKTNFLPQGPYIYLCSKNVIFQVISVINTFQKLYSLPVN